SAPINSAAEFMWRDSRYCAMSAQSTSAGLSSSTPAWRSRSRRISDISQSRTAMLAVSLSTIVQSSPSRSTARSKWSSLLQAVGGSVRPGASFALGLFFHVAQFCFEGGKALQNFVHADRHVANRLQLIA